MVLTNSGYLEGGAAFFSYPVTGTFTANFSYRVYGGNCNGDGFTMFFYKQHYSSLANGGDLAFTGLNSIVPGYGIEFDGWQNIASDFQSIGGQITPSQGDPSNAYIGLIQDSAGNHLAYVNDPRVDDGRWHQVSVVVGESFVGVYVDGGLGLLWDGTLNTTYSGFGFSGANGEVGDNWHIISNFSITLGPVLAPTGTPTPTYTPSPQPTPAQTPLQTPASTLAPINSQLPTEPDGSTQTFSDDFTTDSGAWQYLGSAHLDPANQDLVLTDTGYQEGGVAFFNYPIQGSFTASFSYRVGGGNYNGDGFTMFFYKEPYLNPDNGGSLAFSSTVGSQLMAVPGYGIEFDGWQNIPEDFQQIAGAVVNPPSGDPSSAYIALIEGSAADHLAYVNDPRVDDGNWHQVTVTVGVSSVAVYVDQSLVLKWSGTLNRTYSGFGFSGATGEVGSNYHIIDDFSITAQNLKQPSLTASCIGSISQSSLSVNINGQLTYKEQGIPGAPVLLSYSVTGGQSWQDLTMVDTAADGSYSALWFPSVTGDYLLRAVYQGSENYLGTSDTVNFAMEPSSTSLNVFSITSNSTLSEIYFDSSSNELSFNVTGPSGTTGYVNVYIPKSLDSDISGLKVYLDNSQVHYTAESQNDWWLLYFTYHHSSHTVTIQLASNAEPSVTPNATLSTPEFPASLIFLTTIFAVSATAVILKIKKK